MTPQEQQMIDDLVQRIRNTPVTDKDTDAERHLQQALGSVPDALYVLTQTVLVQQYGLEQAKAQLQSKQDEIETLKHQQDPAGHAGQKGGGSFLSRIFGSDENSAPPASSSSAYQPANYAPPAQSGYPPPPPYGTQYPGASYGGPGYNSGSGMFGGGGGGFLRGALQTAAGVAAGAMVFQGMEDLFRGFGGHESHGFGNMPGETIVNNYYGEEGDRGNGHEQAGTDASGFYNPANDASRDNRDDDGRGFADTGSSDDGTDDNGDDLSESDNGSDFSDGDDGGGFDGGDDSNY